MDLHERHVDVAKPQNKNRERGKDKDKIRTQKANPILLNKLQKKNTKFTNYNYASTSLHFNQASNGFMVNILISGRKSSQVTSYPGTFVVT